MEECKDYFPLLFKIRLFPCEHVHNFVQYRLHKKASVRFFTSSVSTFVRFVSSVLFLLIKRKRKAKQTKKHTKLSNQFRITYIMKIVIIGGVAGGASAAARARRLSEKADILLLQ
jgi:preprotein translocase subunit YajC